MSIHPFRSILLLVFVVALTLAPLSSTAAQTPGVAAQAELLRSQLLTAQLKIDDAQEASNALETAQRAYAQLRAPLSLSAPNIQRELDAAFVEATEAVAAADAVAAASIRAHVWTALLHGAYQIVLDAVARGDVATARNWLLVREYRQATRFLRPGADATLAIAQLAAGEIDANVAVQAIDADLLDVYQTRLREALAALAAADNQQHAIRRAELASLAAGYFSILTPAYAKARGDAEGSHAAATFVYLRSAAAAGQSVAALLPISEALLQHFQAAPLSQTQQKRRANQLLRFLALTPVEYGRGVRNGEVTVDLEIREALTFHAGAVAAFSDLAAQLSERDPMGVAEVETQLAELGALLADAGVHSRVADPASVQRVTDALLADLHQLLPEEWRRLDGSADFDLIQASLDQMERAVAAGDYALAASAQLDAYAILESGPEARLIAFAPQYITVLEELFWYGQGEHKGLAFLLEQGADLREIRTTRAELDRQLASAQTALGGESAPFAILLNAAIIVFREGLEAVVILAALMASMIGARRMYRRPMTWGVAAAFLASAFTWWLMQSVLSAFRGYGERLEAIVSLVAIAVLLLITNWFFHRVYWTDWMADLHDRKQSLLGGAMAGQLSGFVMLGFTSVYREGFETVLFLQALVLEAGAWTVLQGTALGMAGVIGVGWLTFKLQSRLPYKRMLVVTGVLIGAVLLVMVGNTVHVLQLIGWLPIHPIRWLTLPYWSDLWFGLYPTWEGFGLQFAAAAFVIGSYILAEMAQKRGRRNPQGAVQAARSSSPGASSSPMVRRLES